MLHCLWITFKNLQNLLKLSVWLLEFCQIDNIVQSYVNNCIVALLDNHVLWIVSWIKTIIVVELVVAYKHGNNLHVLPCFILWQFDSVNYLFLKMILNPAKSF